MRHNRELKPKGDWTISENESEVIDKLLYLAHNATKNPELSKETVRAIQAEDGEKPVCQRGRDEKATWY